MAVSVEDVKRLRNRTGAGMADCKKALDEANGDMEEAIEILRKKGAATAAKRADHSANEGVITTATSADHRSAAIVEVNCETDFVARNEGFTDFTRKLADYVLESKPASMEALLAGTIDGTTVQDHLNDLLAKFSERIEIRRFEVLDASNGVVADYVHNGDKLAVLVEFSGEGDLSGLTGLGRDIAMQVAAMNPAFVSRESVPGEVLEKEKEIYLEQVANEGKKPEFADKIVAGRIEKFFTESTLLEQSYVKDSSKQVREVLAEAGKEIGTPVSVVRFLRYNLGEQN